MELKLPRPGFWMAALLVFLVLVLQIAFSIPLGILDVVMEHGLHRPNPHLERQPLLVGMINIVAFAVVIALGLRLNRLSFRHAFPLVRFTARQLIGMAITVLGTDILLSEADNLLRALLPPPQLLSNIMKDLFASEDKPFSRLFLLVLVAPLTEELLFRGIILRGLLSRHRSSVAIGLSALLFTALHCNPWQFISPLFLGILLGWIYLRTGSIMLCMLAHALSNGLSMVAMALPVNIPGMSGAPDYAKVAYQPWWLDVSGLGLLLAGLWLFHRATPPFQPSSAEVPPIIP